jgi:pyrroloquinoline quinone biosynthesis protein E
MIDTPSSSPAPPLALIAELTHRCPLHCVYCSNPLELQNLKDELSAGEWRRVFEEGAAAGVLQADLTGGEPLARQDLTEIVAAAHAAGLYVNVITSGLPLPEARLDALIAAGLDHLQLSFQGAREETAREISGTLSHRRKLQVLEWLRTRRVAVTLNFVIHRENVDQLAEMLALAENSCATRVEFAHVQYYGWAFENRARLLPSREHVLASIEYLKAQQKRLEGRLRVEYVVPDYHARYPKACMGGWGRKLMLVTPNGDVLPCHAARLIPGLAFENIEKRGLREIWDSSEAFVKFRGESWMQEPCRSCDRRAQDFGGCRCQALLIAGDASATDPVCSLSPLHSNVEEIVAAAGVAARSAPATLPPWTYRPNPA